MQNEGGKLTPKGAYYVTCIARYQEYIAHSVRTLFHDVSDDTSDLFNHYSSLENIHEFTI